MIRTQFIAFMLVLMCSFNGYSQQVGNNTTQYLVPDFYKPIPETSRDTAFKFECYDKHNELISKVTDFEQVYYFSVFKNYTDSTHTYKDAKGLKQFLPISKIIKRYDKTGKDRWMCINYNGNIFSEIQEYKTTIVRADTLYVNNAVEIYRFYKTAVIEK